MVDINADTYDKNNKSNLKRQQISFMDKNA